MSEVKVNKISPRTACGTATATCGSDTVRVFTSPGTFTA